MNISVPFCLLLLLLFLPLDLTTFQPNRFLKHPRLGPLPYFLLKPDSLPSTQILVPAPRLIQRLPELPRNLLLRMDIPYFPGGFVLEIGCQAESVGFDTSEIVDVDDVVFASGKEIEGLEVQLVREGHVGCFDDVGGEEVVDQTR